MEKIDKVKDILNNYHKAKARIQSFEIDKDTEYSIKSMEYSDMPGSPNQSTKSDVEKFIMAKLDKEEEIELMKWAIKKIDCFVDCLKGEYKKVVKLRHFELCSYERIGVEINYSRQSASKLHEEALEILADYGILETHEIIAKI